MSLVTRLESAAGGAVLAALTRAQRRALRVQEHTHRDRLGRRTPYLALGRPRRGTLVWLHGFSDRRDTFLPTARFLANDFRILIPAMPGFDAGFVDERLRHTFESYADFAAGFLRDVADSPVHLVGNSLGGATALRVAATDPELVSTLVPVNCAGVEVAGVVSVADEIRRGENLFAVRSPADYAAFERRILSKPLPIPRLVKTHFVESYRKKADWYVRIAHDLETSAVVHEDETGSSCIDLGAISAPTLVIWGDRDTLFPVAHGERVARCVKQGRIHLLPQVGHCPHLERPKQLATVIRDFVSEGVEAPSRPPRAADARSA